MHPKVSIVHVEDDPQWQELVREVVEYFTGLDVELWLHGRSLEDVERDLSTMIGPVVLIIDLQLGGDHSDFSGYNWLLEDLENFLHRNASTLVFVVSGQLNAVNVRALRGKGIPGEHIYGKDAWSTDQEKFADVLQRKISQFDDIALRNIAKGVSGENIDPWLTYALRGFDNPGSKVALPLLVETITPDWQNDQATDLVVYARLGNIFACSGTQMSLVALERDQNVVRVEASLMAADFDAIRSMPFLRADNVHKNIGEYGNDAVVAFVDSGIDIFHPAFRNEEGGSRILAIWDQGDPLGPSPEGLFGTVHTHDQICNYLENGDSPPRLQRHNAHGTHATSIAAGSSGQEFTSIAPEAHIVVVIPQGDVLQGGLGYAVSYLSALRFFRDFAVERNLPIVVNVAQGCHAGPHDGTSLLERTFDAFTDNGQCRGLAIVKSAGNERERRGYARLEMFPNLIETLRWAVKDPHQLCTLELWLPSTVRVHARVIAPDGKAGRAVRWHEKRSNGKFKNGNRYALAYTRRDLGNGDTRILVTLHADSADSVEKGTWKLEVRTDPDQASCTLHAWLQRLTSASPVFLDHTREEMTLNVPATARHVITVGAVGTRVPYRVPAYSSYGPTRDGRQKPDIAAPGDRILAAATGTDGGVARLSGTSLAAAHVSGAIALLLSARAKQIRKNPALQQLTADEIHQAVIHSTRDNYGWNPAIGHGVLDVAKLLKSIEEDDGAES